MRSGCRGSCRFGWVRAFPFEGVSRRGPLVLSLVCRGPLVCRPAGGRGTPWNPRVRCRRRGGRGWSCGWGAMKGARRARACRLRRRRCSRGPLSRPLVRHSLVAEPVVGGLFARIAEHVVGFAHEFKPLLRLLALLLRRVDVPVGMPHQRLLLIRPLHLLCRRVSCNPEDRIVVNPPRHAKGRVDQPRRRWYGALRSFAVKEKQTAVRNAMVGLGVRPEKGIRASSNPFSKET